MPDVPEIDAEPRTYGVQRKDREPLVRFMVDALRAAGCRMLHVPEPDRAPFRLTFETPEGERMGVLAYAFLANRRLTKNRPADERRFQVKYGTKDGELHELWQDPYGLYTTLLVAIDVESRLLVSFDPVLMAANAPTGECVVAAEALEAVERVGWHAWEWEPDEGCTQVVVGLRSESVLDCVRFEAMGRGLDPGHRQLLAERFPWTARRSPAGRTGSGSRVSSS